MSDSNNHDEMLPVSGETVEVDGVYKTEWGREEALKRGQKFPSDLMVGDTEWELVELSFDNHHDGRTDARLVPKKKDESSRSRPLSSPRQHLDSGDK